MPWLCETVRRALETPVNHPTLAVVTPLELIVRRSELLEPNPSTHSSAVDRKSSVVSVDNATVLACGIVSLLRRLEMAR